MSNQGAAEGRYLDAKQQPKVPQDIWSAMVLPESTEPRYSLFGCGRELSNGQTMVYQIQTELAGKLVVGAIERDTRRLRLQIIPDRAQDTLELFLSQTVARNSLLLTDAHAGYHDLEFYGYAHERCNHSAGHFGPTNMIENMWGVMKRNLRKLYGCVPTRELALILREWMARQNSPWLFVSPIHYLEATVCSGLVD